MLSVTQRGRQRAATRGLLRPGRRPDSGPILDRRGGDAAFEGLERRPPAEAGREPCLPLCRCRESGAGVECCPLDWLRAIGPVDRPPVPVGGGLFSGPL